MRDIVSGLLLTAFSAVMYWRATLIANPGYDLLGPGFLPKFAVALMGILSAILLAVAVLKQVRQTASAERAELLSWSLPLDLIRQSLIVFLLGAYVYILISGWAHFELASVLFVLSAGAVLAPLKARALIILGITTVLAVFVVSYTFRNILFVNLP
uniref:tripartite tricarboxylate transporter TctB family protein n=1 Tax=Pararhizobium sp. IMCC3301 TaxID=3067904 RepID=UPI002740A536|nr:tripartite tricarboxylate transporter TctB family protein [Pararhizobium sp. IMCC3301]